MADAPENVREAVIRFEKDCQVAGFKGLFLFLDFKKAGLVGVMQSSHFTNCDSVAQAVVKLQADATYLRSKGWNVIREKLECLASNEGVPRTPEEHAPWDHLYFEFHISVGNPDEANMTIEDVETKLRAISQRLASELHVLIPLSYGAYKNHQRFLNTRTYGCGRDESFRKVDQIVTAIKEAGLIVRKVIREFICDDDLTALDNGWLEPGEEIVGK